MRIRNALAGLAREFSITYSSFVAGVAYILPGRSMHLPGA